jgi:starch synthase (maltosyl-transferring)
MQNNKLMDGQKRAIIENVSPQIDSGKFYAKRVLGESVKVEADILGDGHDIVNAVLLYRHEKQKAWREVYMKESSNDRWEASFTVDTKGFYLYTIKAWVDQALSWQHGIERKIKAGDNVKVELLEGALHLEAMIERANKTDIKEIKSYIELFREEKHYEAACKASTSSVVHEWMIKYPANGLSSKYETELKVWVERPRAAYSSWYELFPRSTSGKANTHGTFKDVIKVLPRLADMGMDVLYLPPIHPIGDSFRKGKNNNPVAKKGEPGSPWAIGNKDGGHKSILNDLGTLEDFKLLVKEADKLGIEIALDYALQCSPEHPYVKDHPQWFKWRPDGTVQYAENPPKKYQDVLPINFESEDWKNLWIELKGIFQYWIKQGVKIFRVDNPHTKPFLFWEWVINEIKKENPDVIFLAEAFTRPKIMKQLAKAGFTQSYTYYTWRNSKEDLIEYMTELTTSEMKEYFRPNFWPNTPDILPFNLQGGLQPLFITRFFMAATLSSNYGFYGPVYEFMIHEAMPGKEEYFNSEKYEIYKWDWSAKNKMTELITMVNKIRRNNKALQSTNNIQFCDIQNDQLLAYYKSTEDKENSLLIIVNLDPYHKQSGWVKTPLAEMGYKEGENFVMHDLLTDARYIWNKEWNYIDLDPNALPFHLFRIEKM